MSESLLRLDRKFAEMRLALVLAALFRNTQRATLEGNRPDSLGVPRICALIVEALSEAKASKIASYVALDPVAKEVLSFVMGECDPPVVPPASELSKTTAKILVRMLRRRREQLAPCVITDRPEIEEIEKSLRELGEPWAPCG